MNDKRCDGSKRILTCTATHDRHVHGLECYDRCSGCPACAPTVEEAMPCFFCAESSPEKVCQKCKAKGRTTDQSPITPATPSPTPEQIALPRGFVRKVTIMLGMNFIESDVTTEMWKYREEEYRAVLQVSYDTGIAVSAKEYAELKAYAKQYWDEKVARGYEIDDFRKRVEAVRAERTKVHAKCEQLTDIMQAEKSTLNERRKADCTRDGLLMSLLAIDETLAILDTAPPTNIKDRCDKCFDPECVDGRTGECPDFPDESVIPLSQESVCDHSHCGDIDCPCACHVKHPQGITTTGAVPEQGCMKLMVISREEMQDVMKKLDDGMSLWNEYKNLPEEVKNVLSMQVIAMLRHASHKEPAK